MVLVCVDPSNDRPIYAQVADAVRRAAANAELRPGQKLPAATEIAQSLGVNKHTVLHAYQELRDEGLVDLRRGRGAIITALADDLVKLREEVEALSARADKLGIARPMLAALLAQGDAQGDAPGQDPASSTPTQPPRETGTDRSHIRDISVPVSVPAPNAQAQYPTKRGAK